LDRYFVFGTHDYHPTIDYARTRGLVAEIMKQVDSVKAEKEIALKLNSESTPEHVPGSPIGTASARSEVPEDDDTVIEGGVRTPIPRAPTPAEVNPGISLPATNPLPSAPPPVPPAPSAAPPPAAAPAPAPAPEPAPVPGAP
jgi:hypothetical protein